MDHEAHKTTLSGPFHMKKFSGPRVHADQSNVNTIMQPVTIPQTGTIVAPVQISASTIAQGALGGE
jgi:hypothetical protein